MNPRNIKIFHLKTSHFLKETKFLVKISLFKFLVMTEKNVFIYKCKCHEIFQIFVYFLCKNWNPLKKKITRSFPATLSKNWDPVNTSPPLSEPHCHSHSSTILDLFIYSHPIICSAVAFSPFGNCDVAVLVSIDVFKFKRECRFDIARLMTIFVMIRAVFVIVTDMFHWRMYLNLVLLNFMSGPRL